MHARAFILKQMDSIYKILHFRRMSGLSVDVNVTVWWEDVGGKDERKFIIPLACPDIRGRPRPDELLATKLTEMIPFARWLRLEVQVDNKWILGRKDVVYDQSHDEDARPSEREVMESITRHQREIIWRGDPRVSVELKILPEVPHNVGYFLDDDLMPRIPRMSMTDEADRDIRTMLALLARFG